MPTKHEYTVEMTCGGCSGAVTRVLKKQGEAVKSFEVDLDAKKVVVETELSAEQVLEILKKTGKETKYVGVAS